jgi:D-amino-acid dehydrogenase
MEADRFVFATGAWSAQLSDQLECRIPVEPGKGYSITMERPNLCPRYPMLFPEHNIGVTPFEHGYRLGSMMEFVGYDTSIPEFRVRQLQECARPYLVEPFTETTLETWYGWRPMTWDSLPIIGRVPRLNNAYLATGHNMLGLSLAAGTGKLVAEIVQGQPTHIDARPFSPERF